MTEWVKHPRFRNPMVGREMRVVADVSKQCCSDASSVRRYSYVDTAKICQHCQRSFYFFALEQKYWYEVRQFRLEAQCLYCPECRRKRYKLKSLQREYQLLQQLQQPTVEHIKRFRIVAKTLLKVGCMQDKTKIDKLNR